MVTELVPWGLSGIVVIALTNNGIFHILMYSVAEILLIIFLVLVYFNDIQCMHAHI